MAADRGLRAPVVVPLGILLGGLHGWLDGAAMRHERFVLIDVHSYNHRRGGPRADPTPQADAPDINIGTFSMPRDHWRFLIDPLMEAMRGKSAAVSPPSRANRVL